MNKPELLAPAGNFEALEAAIHGGADAIYVGLKNFGARAFANNFTDQEIVDAIELCHTYGVKLYVTMNTLIKDSEVDEFIDRVRFLHKNGIDAILIQDFGMLMLVREKFPKLEIHASTQFNNSSIDTVKLLKDIGVKRVVFSRELTIEEIKNIDVDIEKEVFVHGALCISYSGCCLFSSMYGNRSGNRGECVGCCRLPYTLQKDGKEIDKGYLLSTKELNTTRNIKELIDAGISCLKIEGRMKSSSYVYFITKLYRNLIDSCDIDIDSEEEKLKVLFNREFTDGHLFNKNNKEIMNTTSPNHKGRVIGKVIGVEKDKIKIKLDSDLNQEDGIRFVGSNKGLIVNFLYDKNKKLVNSASDICYVDNKIDLKSLDEVALTSSKKLEKELLNYPKRKVSVKFNLEARIGKTLTLTVSDGENSYKISTITVEKALNSPTSSERIKEQLMKTGETPYLVTDINLEIDEDIFIPIKGLNEMRRCVLDKLTELRCKVDSIIEKDIEFPKLDIKPTSFLTILVNSEEELLDSVNKYDRIYITKKDIFLKYKDKYMNIYYSGRRNLLEIEKEDRCLIHENSYPKSSSDVADYTLNAFNIYTVYYLHKLGYKCVTLSVELENNEIEELIKNFKNKFGFSPNIELFSKGRVELMIIKGDIFKENKDVELVDSKNRRFKIYYDGIYTHIYDATIFDKLEFYKHNFKNVNLRIDKTFM